MIEIKAKKRILYAPKFAAGENLSIKLSGDLIDDTSKIFLVVKNKNTGRAYAVSGEMNAENGFTGELVLMTTPVYEDFVNAAVDFRCHVYVEAFDVANKRSVGIGYSVLQNSVLMSGTSPADIPGVSTILTTADFANIDTSQIKTVNDLVALVKNMVAASKKENNDA